MDKRIQLAIAFSEQLRKDITPKEFAQLLKLNTPEVIADGGVCHSHDYCDANMTMDAAFKQVYGRHTKPDSDKDISLWNDAWTLAKRNNFYAYTGKVTRVTIQIAGYGSYLPEKKNHEERDYHEALEDLNKIRDIAQAMSWFMAGVIHDTNITLESLFLLQLDAQPTVTVYTKKKRTFYARGITVTQEG